MHFYQDERFSLFIDGSNLYSTAKTLGFDIDYKKLLGYFRKRSRMIRAIYYTALLDDAEYSPIKPLIDWLDYNGYRVVTKPAKEFTDAMGRRKVKGNMDIELAIDVMQLADNLDHIVLFSGDGDFRSLVAAVQGASVGGGATVLFHADIVYAAETFRMRLPFASLGLVPEWASSYMLQANIGAQRAARLKQDAPLCGAFFMVSRLSGLATFRQRHHSAA